MDIPADQDICLMKPRFLVLGCSLLCAPFHLPSLPHLSLQPFQEVESKLPLINSPELDAAHPSALTELSGFGRWKLFPTHPPATLAADSGHQRSLYQLGRELDATPLSFLFTPHGQTETRSREMNGLLKASFRLCLRYWQAHLKKN